MFNYNIDLGNIITLLIFGIIGYLLSRRDDKQGQELVELKSEIANLYKLHHGLEKSIEAHKLDIAKTHYPKNELDARFAQLDTTLKLGFKELSTDIKDMTKALHTHISDEHAITNRREK